MTKLWHLRVLCTGCYFVGLLADVAKEAGGQVGRIVWISVAVFVLEFVVLPRSGAK